MHGPASADIVVASPYEEVDWKGPKGRSDLAGAEGDKTRPRLVFASIHSLVSIVYEIHVIASKQHADDVAHIRSSVKSDLKTLRARFRAVKSRLGFEHAFDRTLN